MGSGCSKQDSLLAPNRAKEPSRPDGTPNNAGTLSPSTSNLSFNASTSTSGQGPKSPPVKAKFRSITNEPDMLDIGSGSGRVQFGVTSTINLSPPPSCNNSTADSSAVDREDGHTVVVQAMPNRFKEQYHGAKQEGSRGSRLRSKERGLLSPDMDSGSDMLTPTSGDTLSLETPRGGGGEYQAPRQGLMDLRLGAEPPSAPLTDERISMPEIL